MTIPMAVVVTVVMTMAAAVAVVASSVSLRWIQASFRQCEDGFSIELVIFGLH
jgi:hypothetical protein